MGEMINAYENAMTDAECGDRCVLTFEPDIRRNGTWVYHDPTGEGIPYSRTFVNRLEREKRGRLAGQFRQDHALVGRPGFKPPAMAQSATIEPAEWRK